MKAVEAPVDELAENAEKLHSLICIAKSNSLRCTAKDKGEEINTLDMQPSEK